MQRSRLRFLFALIVLAVALPARADLQAKALALVRAGSPAAQMGLMAVDLDANQALIQIDADLPLMPASNMKLVTTAAALATLGPEFVFRTELRLVDGGPGQPPWLVILGDGDPGFGDARLLEQHKLDPDGLVNLWVKAVRDAGVTQLAKVVVDDRIFDRQLVHPTWPANQLNSWYCAEVAGLTFNDNCLDIYARPGGAGQAPAISTVPEAPFLKIHNQAVTGGPDNFLITRQANSNDLLISGRLRTPRTSPEFITVHDPALFFARLLAHRLAQAGVTVAALARPGDGEALPRGKALHVVQTTLPLVLERCNKNSQNLFAECLLKRLGYATAQVRGAAAPGSWDNGAAAVTKFLEQRLGSRAANLAIADGSGMSRDNRITATAFTGVLAAMYRDARLGPAYMKSLSIAGRDGTLAERLHTDIIGQVYGKTGYIAGVSTLSGYLVLPASPGGAGGAAGERPRTIAFSFLFNGVRDVHAAKELQDRLVRLIDHELAPAAPVTRPGA